MEDAMRRCTPFPLSLFALALAGACAHAQAAEYKGWVYNGLTGWGTASAAGLEDSGLASNPDFGYRWGRFGVEAGPAWFAELKESHEAGIDMIDTRVKLSGWNAGMNFNHDLGDKWALLLRAGLFNWNLEGKVDEHLGPVSKFTDSGNDWYAGAAVHWHWRKRTDVGFGYTRYRAGDGNLDVWGIASEHRFGKRD